MPRAGGPAWPPPAQLSPSTEGEGREPVLGPAAGTRATGQRASWPSCDWGLWSSRTRPHPQCSQARGRVEETADLHSGRLSCGRAPLPRLREHCARGQQVPRGGGAVAGRTRTPALLGLPWGAGRRKPGDREEDPDGEDWLGENESGKGNGLWGGRLWLAGVLGFKWLPEGSGSALKGAVPTRLVPAGRGACAGSVGDSTRGARGCREDRERGVARAGPAAGSGGR